MSLVNRIEKLHFLAQELELGFALARAQPTDYLRRVLARRVVIRAKDFVNHARQLRKPLRQTGVDVADFHSRKETYARGFGDYFPALRDKVGAHVQDVDLLERLELWNEVEVLKLRYFVDGAREIYVECLGPLNIPSYQPFTSCSELSDQEFLSALSTLTAAGTDQHVAVKMDAFAQTHPDSAWILNESPVHARAKQLVSLIEWLGFESQVSTLVRRWANAHRVIKAQFITDLVSMADCLTTRPVPAGVKQQMVGLDQLLAEIGEDPGEIKRFKLAFKFVEILERVRSVRDAIGGHLEEDENVPLSVPVGALDGTNDLDLFRFFDKLRAVFDATCQKVSFFRTYLFHNQPLTGVLEVHGALEFVQPFDEKKPMPLPPSRTPVTDFSEASSDRQLTAWLERESGDIRQYFWSAFCSPTEIVERGRRDALTFELRSVHVVLLRRFASGDARIRPSLLRLIVQCRNSFPNELVELVLRFSDRLRDEGDSRLDEPILEALGLIHTETDEPVATILRAATKSAKEQIAIAAATALYLKLARPKSGPVANRPQRLIYAPELAPRIAHFRPAAKVLTLLRCVSAYTDETIASPTQEFKDEYAELQRVVSAEASKFLQQERRPALERLLSYHDYVSLGVLLAKGLEDNGLEDDARRVLEAVVNGSIRITSHFDVRASALPNLALALLWLGRPEDARSVALSAARTYPSNLGVKLGCIKILYEAKVPFQTCLEMTDYIKRSYELDASLSATIRELEAELAR